MIPFRIVSRWCLAAALVFTPWIAQADTASGLVFLDGNANGRRDSGERGIAGVKLSNGRDIVVTDAQGRYRIDIEDGQTLFVIKPGEYAAPTGRNGLPQFWRHHFPKGRAALRAGAMPRSDARRTDFALLPSKDASDRFEAFALTDTQVNDAREVGFVDRAIIDPLLRHPRARLGVIMGDLVNDQHEQYPALIASLARARVPWLIAPGNHDTDPDAASEIETTLTFRRHFGPDTFAWEEFGTAFVVLDDVIFTPKEKQRYVGGLREDQFEFLEAYFATLPSDTRVVLAFHIPLFHVGAETFREADRLRLFAMLERFRDPLILSGHTHAQRHHYHGVADGWNGATPLHEYNVGASCGGYWSGLPDENGLPDARMEDGTPNGFARLHFTPERVTMRYFASRGRDELRLGLTSPGVLRRFAYPAYSVYANLYSGDVNAKVEYRIDGGEWLPMQRVDAIDPELLALNIDDARSPELRSRDRAVVASITPHIWHVRVPTTLAAGEHKVEVRATSEFEPEARGETTYTLQDWPQ